MDESIHLKGGRLSDHRSHPFLLPLRDYAAMIIMSDFSLVRHHLSTAADN